MTGPFFRRRTPLASKLPAGGMALTARRGSPHAGAPPVDRGLGRWENYGFR